MRESSFRELAYNKTGQTNGRDAAVYIYIHASLRGLSACLRLSRERRMRARDDSSGGLSRGVLLRMPRGLTLWFSRVEGVKTPGAK